MRRVRRVIAFLLLTAVVCFGPTNRAHEPAVVRCPIDLSDVPAPPPASEQVAYAWHVGRRSGFPVVRAMIAGCAVTALLDTGVSAPVLTPWFAERLGVARRDLGAHAIDLGGRTTGVDAIDPLAVDIPGVATVIEASGALTGRDDLRRYGIAVIAPPQFVIARDRAVALDFVTGTFRKLASTAAADALVDGPPTFETSSECNGELRVPAFVGGVAATLAIDTGSVVSVIFSESAAGTPLAAGVGTWDEVDHTALGGAQAESMIDAVRVNVGDLVGEMPLELYRTRGTLDEPCPFDGVLGTDFLIDRRCLLLFDLGDEVPGTDGLHYTRLRGYCRP